MAISSRISKNALNHTLVDTVYLKADRFEQRAPAKTGDPAMTALWDAFKAVDVGFNAVSATPVLSPAQIAALGFYSPTTTAIPLGPFTPCQTGQHSNHSNQPGAGIAFGTTECSNLQNFFENGVVFDPNFPWDTNLQQDKHPTQYHNEPIVTSTVSPNMVHVFASAQITYAPNGPPPTGGYPPSGNGNVVAVVRASTYYVIDPNNPTAVPQIDAVEFTIAYSDRPLRRLLGNDPFATTIGLGDVVVTVPGSAINSNPPMGSPVIVGNVINISGLTTAVNGIPASDINGNRTVTAVSANTFTFTAGSGSLATSTGSGGGLGGTDGIIVDKQ